MVAQPSISPPDELRYRILRELEKNPNLSQRELADVLGVSVGKANYCVRALARRGWVRMRRFNRSSNKTRYLYVLTPAGVAEKARVTYRYLQSRISEYDDLRREIAALTAELAITAPGEDGKTADTVLK